MKTKPLRCFLAFGLLLVGCANNVPLAPGESAGAARLAAIAPPFFSGPDDPGVEFFLPHAAPTNQELKEPPVLPNTSGVPGSFTTDITASAKALPVLDGPPTQMVVFNGLFPGPTLQVHEGDHVTVHFHNRSPIPANIHFHGMVIPTEQDGNPQNSVPPGGDQDYAWTAKPGFPEFTWYHTHAHGYTHIGVSKGLEALLQVLPAVGVVPPAFGNTTLGLSDNKYDQNNQIPPDNEYDRFNGREGNVILVNGQVLPKLTLHPGEIRRLNIGNLAPARFFRLAIPGVQMLQIGTDGGPLDHPVPIPDLLLANAERAWVLIKAPDVAGTTVPVLLLPYDRGLGPDSKRKVPLTLMTIVTAGSPIPQPPIPSTLKHVPPLDTSQAAGRTFELARPSVGGGVHHFGIDDTLFDPLRIDNVATNASTEIWTIKNKQGKWDHPMHLHSTQFQVLDVNGVPPITGPAWKDTVLVPANSVARIAVPFFNNVTGIYMFHCHILAHENDGMMTTVMVDNGPPFKVQNPPATEDKTAPSLGEPFPPLPFAGTRGSGFSVASVRGPLTRWCGPGAPPNEQAHDPSGLVTQAGLRWWTNGALAGSAPALAPGQAP